MNIDIPIIAPMQTIPEAKLIIDIEEYNRFVNSIKNNKNYNIENEISKNIFYEYLTFEYENSINSTSWSYKHYKNALFEEIVKSNNMNNFEYILKSGININNSLFEDYGSLFQIVLSEQYNYEIMEKQLNMLIQYGFDVNNFTLGDGYNGTDYDDEYPSLLFYITSYSLNIVKRDDFFKIYSLLKKFGVNPDIYDKRGCTYDFYLTSAIAEPINENTNVNKNNAIYI